MFGLKLVTVSCLVILATAQDYQDYGSSRQQPHRLSPNTATEENRPTPVPILKQINKHNEDGSYTYGYEGADGSFKIETKLATGEVKGKYGYVDETGKVRIVEYGANKYGFQPSGEGITVAPPTLVDETTNKGRISDYEEEQPRPYIARVQRPQIPQRANAPAPSRSQYSNTDDYDEEQSNRYNNPQPQQPQYQAPQLQQQPQQYNAPTPPRVQIPNAVPIDVVYSARQRPARPDPEYSQKQLFSPGPSQGSVRLSQPQAVQYSPAPIPRPQPQPQPQQLHHQQQPQQQTSYVAPRLQQQQPQSQGRSTSVLDQLAKDYALPAGGSQPLHDISFGYY